MMPPNLRLPAYLRSFRSTTILQFYASTTAAMLEEPVLHSNLNTYCMTIVALSYSILKRFTRWQQVTL
ncbi:uncharacterized protein PHALS_14608 [Plasmopara halstedii]|uniref:Uncharacterized protein n=1 Tax=Plasmopara halstedii TaxID=4781 RepID=A0A0P1AMT3_PLAHL|nr:uncharacterized protein PHALS_14608 [Plasmopara halstedii]CEG42271.1 hypothetical protein PHALS_14608 [Plasmopara halstedii]|eukprot:XP_024578640.1 hypothetical protein PHALS_14608 [Plasmopara halstedii]